jgi:tetratricopeptide (TPR) repeat protein
VRCRTNKAIASPRLILLARVVESQGNLLWATHRRKEATQAYRQAVDLRRQIAQEGRRFPLLTDTAWFLACCPDKRFRNPVKSVELAKAAVDDIAKFANHEPRKEGNCWKTLGVARYRAGAWKAAVAALDQAMKLRNGGDSTDWFVLAMAHWQLDDQDEARRWYDKAVQWMDRNKPKDPELRGFRAEAAELLSVKEK